MNPTQLSDALALLADAIDQLAVLVKDQKGEDKTAQLKQFSVIVQKFDSITQSQGSVDWTTKYKKGYLKRWLKEKDLVPAQAKESLKGDDFLVKAAAYLAAHFDQLGEFYQRLKYGQSLKSDFIFKTNRAALPYIVQWAKMLKEHKFIDDVTETQEEVHIDIAELANATSFINGFWLELHLRSLLAKILKENFDKVQTFDVLSQLQLLKPDSKFTELDLLLMVNDKVYWFECKTGDIGGYYQIFTNHRKLLGLEIDTSVAIIPSPNVQMIANFRKKSGMQTFDSVNLETQLMDLLFNN